MSSLAAYDVTRSADSPALLEAINLTVESGNTKVLRDLSFTLPRGRILGLIGESGAGKSMVGRIIANQLPPGFAVSAGSLHFDGDDLLSLARPAHRELLGRRIAFVPQEPMGALNPSVTIGNHFAEHLARLGVPASERRVVTLEALAEMRLPAPDMVFDKYPFQLSGGMCQRVLIALAFVSKPDLVIADEPTASLDVTTQVHIIGLLRGLQHKYGTGVLFITHQLRLAAHLCDDVAVLYAGEIVEFGPAGTVFRRPQHPYTRALETANPRFSGPWRQLSSPPGHMPGLNEFRNLPGCRFAPRCASAIGGCTAAPPSLRILKEKIAVRCIRDEAMPAAEPEAVTPPPAVTEATAPPLLQVDRLFKMFRSGGVFLRRAESPAVNGISFSIAAGEFIGIVGETGSGKSTLGRMIMGLEKPTAGRILLDGEAHRPHRSRLGQTHPQHPARVSRSSFGAQSASDRAASGHAADAGHALSHSEPAETCRAAVAGHGFAAGCRVVPSQSDLRRPAPTRQYRPRALRHAAAVDCRRDCLGP